MPRHTLILMLDAAADVSRQSDMLTLIPYAIICADAELRLRHYYAAAFFRCVCYDAATLARRHFTRPFFFDGLMPYMLRCRRFRFARLRLLMMRRLRRRRLPVTTPAADVAADIHWLGGYMAAAVYVAA